MRTAEGVDTGEPLVAVSGLTHRFDSGHGIIGLDLAVAAGQVTGLVGANGGGKTTGLRLLAGLLRPDAGTGRVLGYDLLRAGREIRRLVGYVAQRFALYPTLSVFDNLRFRAEVYDMPRPLDAARATIADYGLEQYASVRAERLSGGWARLLQLAAGLIHAPRLVLLDEPTAGLDASARQAVWQRIARLAGAGCAVVIATHDLAEAERCSNVSVLANGRVRAQGTPREIARRAPVRAFVVSGQRAIALAGCVASIPGAIAAYPAGGDLRVLADDEVGEALETIARSRSCRSRDVEPTLEDATLALARRTASAE